jgi:hypothetical protein
MKASPSETSYVMRIRERGGSRINFLIVAAIIAGAIYVGYYYVPVALHAYQFKDQMQQDVERAAALGQNSETLAKQIKSHGADFGVPPNAVVTVGQTDGRLSATVKYTIPLPLPGPLAQYDFDYTAKSSSLFAGK